MPLLQWHIKSTTKAQQGLYEYDAVSRLRDSQLADIDATPKRQGHPQLHRQGRAVAGLHRRQPVVLLIDEIDKADIEFPNDLLREIDRMEFYVYETRELVRRHRPLVFITSNNEKELPDAFLRRCFFHYIKFPDAETMQRIVDVHFPGLKKELLGAAMKTFYDVRNLPGLKKKPSTSELLDWLKLLVAEDIPLEALQSKDDKVAVPPLVGALLKNEQDVTLFEKLVFMQRHTTAEAPSLTRCPGPGPTPVSCAASTPRSCRWRPGTPPAWPTPRCATASSGGSGTPRCPRPRAWPPRSRAAWRCRPPAACCPSRCSTPRPPSA
jgi:MoxR-like ATPase